MPALDLNLVHRQEAFLHRHPMLFRFKVLLQLLLGLLLFGLIVLGSLGVLALLALLLATGKAWVVAAKLIKVVWLLLLPLWGMLRISVRALCWRMPKPSGRQLQRDEAPALFEALERMRREMKGPRISGVFLIDEMNAYAMSRPLAGFWFLFIRQHYIGLGVPLIQTLSEDEALAVVAHEYGHISGHPSRFDAFVYRLRWRLLELLQQAGQWDDWPSRWLGRLLNWYIPRFDQLAFALCRASEYAADRAGSQLIGATPAAQALMRLRVAENYIHRDFWPRIHGQVGEQADPQQVRPWSRLPALVRETHNDDLAADLLRDALHEETAALDTHPALRDRLAALQFDTTHYLGVGQSLPPVAERTAAESWFGERLATVLDGFDQRWAESVGEAWRSRHENLREQRQRRAELEGRDATALNDDEAWDLLVARIDADEVANPDDEVWQFIQQHPAHALSRLAWARRNLGEAQTQAVKTLFECMRLDPQLRGQAASVLMEHFADDPLRHKMMEVLLRRTGEVA
ncbi:M48 family metallopeptidase [Pseudomonas sp. LA21]|uniref:M48 family metallopeptidase n=1 Tax=unclassified Pseudomonas TaxID=196821 RepID=UPI001FB8043F|nr:M48 family metallopeptidase [Pseudomonas sp. LA21]MCJ1884725.1 M48 family metallopeptidase [Pseudomonas sp. LA21]